MHGSLMALLITALAITTPSNGQQYNQAMHQKVLKKAVAGRTVVFGRWTEKGGHETHLTYLGRFTTRHGKTYKIMNQVWYWGLSHRATSRILVYNGKNQYAGNYSLTMNTDLPVKMTGGRLIFKNAGNDCDKRLMTVVNLKNGLPRQFFKKCKGQAGDIYRFES